MLPAAPCYQEEIAQLITVMMRDADLQEPDREEARQYAEGKSVSGSLFLWENEEGKIVSMTDITPVSYTHLCLQADQSTVSNSTVFSSKSR